MNHNFAGKHAMHKNLAVSSIQLKLTLCCDWTQNKTAELNVSCHRLKIAVHKDYWSLFCLLCKAAVNLNGIVKG